MDQLLAKKIRFSVTEWGEKGPEPHLYEGLVSEVSGTMIYVVCQRKFTGEAVHSTRHNTASMLFNWIQIIE